MRSCEGREGCRVGARELKPHSYGFYTQSNMPITSSTFVCPLDLETSRIISGESCPHLPHKDRKQSEDDDQLHKKRSSWLFFLIHTRRRPQSPPKFTSHRIRRSGRHCYRWTFVFPGIHNQSQGGQRLLTGFLGVTLRACKGSHRHCDTLPSPRKQSPFKLRDAHMRARQLDDDPPMATLKLDVGLPTPTSRSSCQLTSAFLCFLYSPIQDEEQMKGAGDGERSRSFEARCPLPRATAVPISSAPPLEDERGGHGQPGTVRFSTEHGSFMKI